MGSSPLPDAAAGQAPERLVVVGAAAGMGRWLCLELFSRRAWAEVTVLDVDRSVEQLAWPFDCPTTAHVVPDDLSGDGAPSIPALGAPRTAVCLAIPQEAIQRVGDWILPQMAPDSIVFDVASSKVMVMAALARIRPSMSLFGAHPLFGPGVQTLEGQTIVVCASDEHPTAHQWFGELVQQSGGLIKALSPERHDLLMQYIQTLTHQTLLNFVDVLARSGFDIESDLWEARTPPFETLLGLASRVLMESQEETVSAIQLSTGGASIGVELNAAQERTIAAIDAGEVASLRARITELRDNFGGTFLSKMLQTASAVLAASQQPKATLAHHRREGSLVGVVAADRLGRLVVGRVQSLTPTTVVIEELMVGPRGRAVILEGAGAGNAKRLGIQGRSRLTEFGLGRLAVLSGPELERELDDWLGTVTADVRLLVPESVGGIGVVAVLEQSARIKAASLLSDVMRFGHRAVTVRVSTRADNDLADTIRHVQALVGHSFTWPFGSVLPLDERVGERIGYLGPAGTFSETAAVQLATLVGMESPDLVACPAFSEALAMTADGTLDLAVVPICNSSTGLVEPAVAAILDQGSALTAIGLVDVVVRFDAYVPKATRGLEELRGAPLYSHVQGLRQCEKFIQRWGFEPREVSSTAEACSQVAAMGAGIAVAGPGLGDKFDLEVAETEVADLPGAVTRFLVFVGRDRVGEAQSADPTMRTLWLASEEAGMGSGSWPAPGYVEMLTGLSGATLVVSISDAHTRPLDGAVLLGRLPWSPRTPIISVGAATSPRG